MSTIILVISIFLIIIFAAGIYFFIRRNRKLSIFEDTSEKKEFIEKPVFGIGTEETFNSPKKEIKKRKPRRQMTPEEKERAKIKREERKKKKEEEKIKKEEEHKKREEEWKKKNSSNPAAENSSFMNKKIKIYSEEDIANNIKDPKLKKIYETLKIKNVIFLKGTAKGFETEREVELFLVETTINRLNERFDALKSNLSKLRKKGVSIKILEIEVLLIPSKIKVFKSTLKEQDLQKVLSLFEEFEKEIARIVEKENISLEE